MSLANALSLYPQARATHQAILAEQEAKAEKEKQEAFRKQAAQQYKDASEPMGLGGISPQMGQPQSGFGPGQPEVSTGGGDPMDDLRSFISIADAGGKNVGNGGAPLPGGLTFDDAMAWGSDWRSRKGQGAQSGALGLFQFMPETMGYLKKKMGLKGDEPFTPELQNQMATELMKRRGLDKYLAGELSDEEFAHNLSMEWAALPKDESGVSYYAGVGANPKKGQKLPTSWSDTLKAVRALKEKGTGALLSQTAGGVKSDKQAPSGQAPGGLGSVQQEAPKRSGDAPKMTKGTKLLETRRAIMADAIENGMVEQVAPLIKQLGAEASGALLREYNGPSVSTPEGAIEYSRHAGQVAALVGGDPLQAQSQAMTNAGKMNTVRQADTRLGLQSRKEERLTAEFRGEQRSAREGADAEATLGMLKAVNLGERGQAHKLAKKVGVKLLSVSEPAETQYSPDGKELISFDITYEDDKGKVRRANTANLARIMGQEGMPNPKPAAEARELEAKTKKVEAGTKRLNAATKAAEAMFGGKLGEAYFPEDYERMVVSHELLGMGYGDMSTAMSIGSKRINDALDKEMSSPDGIGENLGQLVRGLYATSVGLAEPMDRHGRGKITKVEGPGKEWGKFFREDQKSRSWTVGHSIASTGWSEAPKTELREKFGNPLKSLLTPMKGEKPVIQTKKQYLDAGTMLGLIHNSGSYDPTKAAGIAAQAIKAGVSVSDFHTLLTAAKEKDLRLDSMSLRDLSKRVGR